MTHAFMGRCAMVLVACSMLGAALPLTCFDAPQRLDLPGGKSELSYNFKKSIATLPDGSVHAVWQSDRGDGPQVFYRRSVDRGRTWLAPQPLSEPNAQGAHPAIAAANGRIHVAWHQSLGSGLFVVARSSSDGGGEFSDARVLSRSGQSSTVSLAASGEAIHAVFVEVDDGFAEVYHAASFDGGTAFSEPARISTPFAESWVPSLAVEGDRVVVAWVDYRDGNEEEYVRVSSDGGEVWGAVTRVTANPADSWAPSLALSGDSIWLAFFDRRFAGLLDPDVEAPLDAVGDLLGLDFPPSPPRNPGDYYLDDFDARIEAKRAAIEANLPGFVAGGGDPALVMAGLEEFERRHQIWVEGWGLMLTRSDDFGATWSPPIPIAQPGGPARRPSIALDGSALHVVWFDGRHGNSEVYYRLLDRSGGGAAPEQRLTHTPTDSLRPSVSSFGGAVQVLWYEEAAATPGQTGGGGEPAGEGTTSAILHRRGVVNQHPAPPR